MHEMWRRTFLATTGTAIGALLGDRATLNHSQQTGIAADGRDSQNMYHPDVIIWEDDGTVRSSGVNGENEGSDAAGVIQAALDSLPSDETFSRTVTMAGSMDISTSIRLPDRVALDLTSTTLRAAGDNHVLAIEGTTDALVVGGVLDGEGQSDGEQYLGVIGTNKAERVTILGTDVQNGGYYGINLFDANDCLLWGVSSNENYRHGIHPGSTTDGWGRQNRIVHCTAANNGVDGINDRGSEGTASALHNQYLNCIARENGQNGFHLSDGSTSDEDRIATYHLVGCQSIDNERRGFRVGSAEASLVRPVADGNDIGVLIDGSNRVSVIDPYVTNRDQSDATGIMITGFDSGLKHCVLVSGGVIHTQGENLLIDTEDGTGSITIRDVDADGGGGSPVEHSGYVSDLTVRNVDGYSTAASSREYKGGDGETTQFSWSHELSEAPASISVTPGSEDALGEYFADANGSEITVVYQEPPPEGTDNLKWWWRASIYS